MRAATNTPDEYTGVEGGVLAERSDAELSEQLVAGDVDAFRTVVERFHAPVSRLAFRLLGWSGDVDDVVQDVFTAAWRGRESFARGSSIATWLMGITVNHCRMRQRWWVRYRRRLAAVTRGPRPPNAASADKAVFDRERCERVRAAVGSLPVIDREVVVLRYLQELPLDDVAKVLSLPVNTVEVRLHRARKRLRPLLNDLLQE